MKRSYKQGTSSNATYFVGIEVEHTPAYGRKTLFVTGLQDVDEITGQYSKNGCEHISNPNPKGLRKTIAYAFVLLLSGHRSF